MELIRMQEITQTMSKMNNIIFCIALVTALMGCVHTGPSEGPDVPSGPQTECRWDFDSVEGWAYAHQDTASISQWSIENGSLYLRTRAHTRDRSKMYTTRNDFQGGEYTWRIFVTNIKPYEQVSIGGFIYQDDEHEIDFEIGYGTKAAREEYGASDGELLACMTNQGHPFSSSYVPITPGWHTFTIKLEEKGENYLAHWIIDDVTRQSLPLDFGPKDARFTIMCSVENLLFMGEKIPENDNYARFDYVSFKGRVTGEYEPGEENVSKSFKVSGDFPSTDKTQANVFANGKSFTFTYSAATSTLEGAAKEASDYYALYPFDVHASAGTIGITSSLGTGTVAATSADGTKMLSVAKAAGEELAFTNVLSIIEFSLPDALSKVSEITLSADGISGNCTVDMDDYEVYASGKELKVSAPNGVFATGRNYYAAIPAKNYKSLKVTIKNDDDVVELEKTELKAKRGAILSLGELKVEQEDVWKETRWDFDNGIDGWYYYTHTANPSESCYSITDGMVKIWTNANTMERNKLHTIAKSFTEGIYTFRTYVTPIAAGEKCSIGAFIYSDDSHEIDFEIGYGTKAAREGCGAKADEMVACMTNQGLPFNSTYTPISVGWHDLTLCLTVVNGKYQVEWYIDSELKKTLNVKFGPETRFLISISVENLEFMGEKIPTHTNYALFDYVSYKKKITN